MDARHRTDPTLDDEGCPATRTLSPLTYERVQAAVDLTRQLATVDYFNHLDAVATAKTEEEKAAAVQRLQAAERAARLADSAYQSLISSAANFRRSTTCMVSGDEKAAVLAATDASHHLDIVGDKLEFFGDYAPRSRFFQKAIHAIVAVDQAAGQLEDKVVRSVESFSRGLKALAGRVREFGAEVALAPQRVKEKAAEAGANTASAAMSLFSRVMGRARTAGQRAAEVVLDEVEKFADHAVSRAMATASTVDLHARAAVGLAGGLMGRMAAAVKEGYNESLDAAEVKRSARRAGPR